MRDNMAKYEAIFVAPDGLAMTDFKKGTMERVREELKRYNKWSEFPYVFIIKADKENEIIINPTKKKIIDVIRPHALKFMKGWTLIKVIKTIMAENAKLKRGETWGF